jgi:hypothetical protein
MIDQNFYAVSAQYSRSSVDSVDNHDRKPWNEDRFVFSNQQDQTQQVISQRDSEREDDVSGSITNSHPRGCEGRILVRKFHHFGCGT